MAQVQQYPQPPAGMAVPPYRSARQPDPWNLNQFMNENWPAIIAGSPPPGPDYDAVTAERSNEYGPPMPEQKGPYGWDWWRNSQAKRDLDNLREHQEATQPPGHWTQGQTPDLRAGARSGGNGEKIRKGLEDFYDYLQSYQGPPDHRVITREGRRDMMAGNPNPNVAAKQPKSGAITPASYTAPAAPPLTNSGPRPAPPSPGVRPQGAGLASGGRGTQRTSAGSIPAAMTPKPNPASTPASTPAAAPDSASARPDLYAQALAALNGQGQQAQAAPKGDGGGFKWDADTRMALLQAGLATMAAASRPGASALGSIGQDGMAGLAGYRARKNAAKDERRQSRAEQFQRGQVLAQLANAQATAEATAAYRAAQQQHQRNVLAERARGNDMPYQARMLAASKPPASAYPETWDQFRRDYMKSNADSALTPKQLVDNARRAYYGSPPPPDDAYVGDEPPSGIDGARRSDNGAWYTKDADGEWVYVKLQ